MEIDTSSATTWRVVNIIKEECAKAAGQGVEEALVCCTLKMIYDNPRNGFDRESALDRHAVRRLIGEPLVSYISVMCHIFTILILHFFHDRGIFRGVRA